MQQFSIPYRALPGDHEARPYLVLQVTGPNGSHGPIYGVVDSGADQTCLPLRFTPRWAIEFALWPTFLPEGHVALWGRADLFRQFGILFEEEAQRLILRLRE